jgi:hypothetical protein
MDSVFFQSAQTGSAAHSVSWISSHEGKATGREDKHLFTFEAGVKNTSSWHSG